MRGKGVITNVHFHKTGLFFSKRNAYGQPYIKPDLNQAGRKKSRRIARQKKAAAIAPRPTSGLLRPAVHPPTSRYNLKIRAGRGFTLEELKEAKIPKKLARTIGIAVDHRRRNKCAESLQMNVQRLTLYKSKLKIFPKKAKAKAGGSTRAEVENVPQNTSKYIIPLPDPWAGMEEARAIKSDEKEFQAYKTIKKARTNKHYLGAVLMKQKKAAGADE